MKIQFGFLLLLLLIFHFGCKNSTQANINSPSLDNTISDATITTRSDSLQYVRSSGRANVLIRINNKTDSTLVFPSCGTIHKRIDIKQGNIWSAGFPEWNSPCIAIYLSDTQIQRDSSYVKSTYIDSTGTFRVVTIYGPSGGSYPDTLFSNEFIVL